MKPSQIEAWALQVIERTLAGLPDEDARVELKADWPAPEKAARRLAGHANAAKGEAILWLIGVDERDHKLTSPKREDLASWFPQVTKCFDGSVCPEVTDIVVTHESGTVIALYFSTDRAPYLTRRDQDFLEVPWRHGTLTRSANRRELLLLLSDIAATPSIELLDAELTYSIDNLGRQKLSATLKFFLEASSRQSITLLNHKVVSEITFLQSEYSTRWETIKLRAGSNKSVEEAIHGLIFSGPSVFLIEAETVFLKPVEIGFSPDARLVFELGYALNPSPIVIRVALMSPPGKSDPHHRIWVTPEVWKQRYGTD